jgi:hypothetical protein
MYQLVPCPTLNFSIALFTDENAINVLAPLVNTSAHLLSKLPNESLEFLWIVQNFFLRIACESLFDLGYHLLHAQHGTLQVKLIKLCKCLQ